MFQLRRLAASFAVAFVALSTQFYSPALADSTTGLDVAVYSYDSAATPDRQPYVLCDGAWTHVDNIDADFDNQFGGVVAGCQQEFTLVHFTGYVMFPDSGVYAFQAWAYDVFWLSLDGAPVISNDWVLKGRWGNVYPDVAIEGGHTYALDAWYYEYGGGANVTLTYSADNGASWATVPKDFFTTNGLAPVVVPPVVVPPVIVEPPIVVEPPVVTPPVVEPPFVEPVVIVVPTSPVKPVIVPPVIVPPKVVEPPVVAPVAPKTPEILSVPLDQIVPTELTATQVVELETAAVATLAAEPEDSPAYNEALAQLYVAAQADDLVVDEQLAAVPVLGSVAVGLTNAVNALGNLGSDMSPAHRAKAKKEIVAAVVATGAAVNAVTSVAGGSVAIRRKAI